jgi:hypothetical protein
MIGGEPTAVICFLSLSAPAMVSAQGSVTRCVPIASHHVSRGENFFQPLPRGLEFRLRADLGNREGDPNYWAIEAGPAKDRRVDFLWITSIPWQSAPHRIIGRGYGLSAGESLQMSPRTFRFVLNASDYAEARTYYDGKNQSRRDTIQQLERLGRGTVSLEIINSAVKVGKDGRETDFIDWFEFRAKVCVPTD